MTPLLLILAIAIGPGLILYFLKVKAVYVYLSLCMGEVLSFFLGSSAKTNNLILNNELLASHLKSNNDIRLGLLLLPVVIVTIMMIGTAGHKKYSPNIISCLAVGLLAVYLVIPLLNFDSSLHVSSSSIWQKAVLYQPYIIAGTALYILVMLLFERPKPSHGKHKKHKGTD